MENAEIWNFQKLLIAKIAEIRIGKIVETINREIGAVTQIAEIWRLRAVRNLPMAKFAEFAESGKLAKFLSIHGKSADALAA